MQREIWPEGKTENPHGLIGPKIHDQACELNTSFKRQYWNMVANGPGGDGEVTHFSEVLDNLL